MAEITELLQKSSHGDRAANEELLGVVYLELKKLARSYMRKESSDHTLQPTALVHEAYCKLVQQDNVQWKNRSHFYGIAAQLMRRILIDHARKKHAEKRGGEHADIAFEEMIHSGNAEATSPIHLIQIDSALDRLEKLEPRQARVVELRFFAGLGVEETAEALETSVATVKRDWALAKAYLFRELKTN